MKPIIEELFDDTGHDVISVYFTVGLERLWLNKERMEDILDNHINSVKSAIKRKLYEAYST